MKPSRKKIPRAASRIRLRDCAFLASRRSLAASAGSSPISSPRAGLSLEDVVTPLVPVGIEQLGLDVALAEARDHDDDDLVALSLGGRVFECRHHRRARRDAA